MTAAIKSTEEFPILVRSDWTDADNAAEDLIYALETALPGVWAFPMATGLEFILVQLQSGMTALGLLNIAAITGGGTWSAGWGTYPEVGSFVYLVDLWID